MWQPKWIKVERTYLSPFHPTETYHSKDMDIKKDGIVCVFNWKSILRFFQSFRISEQIFQSSNWLSLYLYLLLVGKMLPLNTVRFLTQKQEDRYERLCEKDSISFYILNLIKWTIYRFYKHTQTSEMQVKIWKCNPRHQIKSQFIFFLCHLSQHMSIGIQIIFFLCCHQPWVQPILKC